MTPYYKPATDLWVPASARTRRTRPNTRKPAAGGGGTFTLYPSAASGFIECFDGDSYANARSGTGSAAFTVDTAGSWIYAGQYWASDHHGQIYSCYQSFLDFDLSGITGSSPTATLSLGLISDFSNQDFTVEARTHDWGASLTTADFVAGADLGGKTLLATLASSGIGATGSYKAMTQSGSALNSAVSAGGTLRILLCSDRQRLNNEPLGLEYLEMFSDTHATLKPKLVVVTT